MFFAEAPGPTEEKLAPQIHKTAASLWRLYAGLTAAEVIALGLAGMPWFDAVCHAMTTLAAGGFSPHAQSIMGYDSALIEWIVCLFMFLAGANFALQYRALLGRPGALFRDDEFRAYAGIVALAAASLALLLWTVESDGAPLRRATFQVLSILTTTGYATADFELWNDRTKLVLLAMMFIGGCAGSAAGGPKVLRHMLVGRFTLLELRRTLHPRGVLPVKLGGKVVPDEVIRSVLVFFLFYVLVFAVCTAIVIGLGEDIETAVTATDRHSRQHRPRLRRGRPDVQLRRAAPGQQADADRGHVDRASRGGDRARPAAARGLDERALAGDRGLGRSPGDLPGAPR